MMPPSTRRNRVNPGPNQAIFHLRMRSFQETLRPDLTTVSGEGLSRVVWLRSFYIHSAFELCSTLNDADCYIVQRYVFLSNHKLVYPSNAIAYDESSYLWTTFMASICAIGFIPSYTILPANPTLMSHQSYWATSLPIILSSSLPSSSTYPVFFS